METAVERMIFWQNPYISTFPSHFPGLILETDPNLTQNGFLLKIAYGDSYLFV